MECFAHGVDARRSAREVTRRKDRLHPVRVREEPDPRVRRKELLPSRRHRDVEAAVTLVETRVERVEDEVRLVHVLDYKPLDVRLLTEPYTNYG